MSRIVGVCRFSFLGKGDWARFRGKAGALDHLISQQAGELYDADRMARRFASFENLVLPCLRSQTDKEFTFIVLTSARMPEVFQARLQASTKDVPQIRLHFAESFDLTAELQSLLELEYDAASGDLVQFRLDDDDCLADRFIENLRSHCDRMAGLPAYAVSFARNLAVTLYDGQPVRFWRYNIPFSSFGLAVKTRSRAQTVFSFGHFAVQKRFDNILDQSNLGALAMKWPSDSRPVDLGRTDIFQQLDEAEFRNLLARSFPFAQRLDFSSLMPTRIPTNS